MSNDETPPDPTEDQAAPASAFLSDAMPFDASIDVKSGFFGGVRGSTINESVDRPGVAETVGAGGRAAVTGAHNWVPIGPRNVGGRVRCIAVDQSPAGDQRVMYAGPASGGIFKTIDAGETWFPLWHDEPSLSMGAIAIAPSDPATVWAGTGESSTGGGESIPPSGVWRSTDAGVTWTNPTETTVFGSSRVAALAVDPTNPGVCWAATDNGVFRTLDGGSVWEHYADGQAYSDICMLTIGPTTWVFLAMSGDIANRAVIVRIDGPSAPHANLQTILPDSAPPDPRNTFSIPAAPDGPGANPVSTSPPGDGKLAAVPVTGGVGPFIYAAWARADRTLYRVFRISNLDAVNSARNPAMTVDRLANHSGFADLSQGNYNLAIAVNPLNPAHIAFGMQEIYVNRSATAASSQQSHWRQVQNQFLYITNRGHHADHHQFIFAPRPATPFDRGVGVGAVWLWDANDGGISVCADWNTATAQYASGEQALPLPPGVPTWRKRSHGITAAQMYDLTQHPRLPSVIASGYQDNGSYVSTGGMTWDLILTADGGYVAFDPDDPYRVIATFQTGVTETRFPARLRDAVTLLRDGVQTGAWPRQLTDGFRGSDRASFVAETVFHPTRPGRVFNVRRNRLYATRATTGDRWRPEPIGCGVEIIHEPATTGATAGSLEVLDTPGAMAIGLLAQRNETTRAEDRRLGARVRTLLEEPFDIRNGERLQFVLHDDTTVVPPPPITIALNVGPDLPASASAVQLAAYINAHGPAGVFTALPVVWPPSSRIALITRGTGRARSIGLDGTAMVPLVMVARVSRGADLGNAFGGGGLPAVTFIQFGGTNDLSGTRLIVTHDAGPATNIDFPAGSEFGVHELARRLRAALPDAVLVSTNPLDWGIRLTTTVANRLADLTGSGPLISAHQPASPARSFSINGSHVFSFTPPPPPFDQVRIVEQNPLRQTPPLELTVAGLGTASARNVTSVELVHAFRQHLAAVPAANRVRVRVDLDLNPLHADDWAWSIEGLVTEVSFAPSDANIAWVGDLAGRMYRSGDGGDTWQQVTPLPGVDGPGEVDAIAIHPTNPSTVIAGIYAQGAFVAPHAFLFKTDDDGVSWSHIGGALHDALGNLVGVRAVEFDRSNPDRLFAGTDIGVWVSTNGGTSWDPFNEGLPNARIADLVLEPHQQLLRAGLWGRGVFERHVGTQPAKDVRLHLRTTSLDNGWDQPMSGPAVDALVPGSVTLDASPDIKQTAGDPRRGLVLDGVEFDEDVVNEPIRPGNAFVAVQVNNRGAFSTTSARVALLWAPADDGPPVLPDQLWDALAAGNLTAGSTFGTWTTVDDLPVADDQHVGHDIVAPGYPRAVIFGSGPTAFEWKQDKLEGHRQIGLLALTRCVEDPLTRGPSDVFDLIHTDTKAAYRACEVVDGDGDGRIVMRSDSGFTVAAPGGNLGNAANGAAPFGLSATAVATPTVEFATAGPYNLSGGAVTAFRVRVTHDVTIPFSVGDPAIRNLAAAFADEVAQVVNRSMIDAGIPVRADSRTYPGNFQDALAVTPIGGAELTFSAAGNAAGRLGMAIGVTRTAAQGQSFITPFANRGPFNLTLATPGVDRTLVCTVVVNALIQFPATTKEIPSLAEASAHQVRAAINRQCREAGIGVVAERRRRGISVRQTSTEAAGTKVVTGGFGLGDLVVVPGAEVAVGAARDALFDVVTTWGRDVLVHSATNRLYLRSTNTGNVALAAVRHRLFQVTPDPVGVTAVGTTVDEPRAPGVSGVAALSWDVGALEVGSRMFVLAVADTAADPVDPTLPASITSLEAAHAFWRAHPNAAIREFVVT